MVGKLTGNVRFYEIFDLAVHIRHKIPFVFEMETGRGEVFSLFQRHGSGLPGKIFHKIQH